MDEEGLLGVGLVGRADRGDRQRVAGQVGHHGYDIRMLTETAIYEALRHVNEPELGRDIVSIGAQVRVEGLWIG